jgi:hypothetical protein
VIAFTYREFFLLLGNPSFTTLFAAGSKRTMAVSIELADSPTRFERLLTEGAGTDFAWMGCAEMAAVRTTLDEIKPHPSRWL